jgi:hypothetical protein
MVVTSTRRRFLGGLSSLTLAASVEPNRVSATEMVSGSEALRDLARDATIFGFAVVEHYKALWTANSPESALRAEPYRYRLSRKLYGPSDRVVVNPNNDTIYGGCSLDLRAEPAVLTVPAVSDCFYSIQFISCDTDDFAYVGTRSTGSEAKTCLIAGPDWQGDVPETVDLVLRSPSQFALAPLRLSVTGSADIERALNYEPMFVLQPLSAYLGVAAPSQPSPVNWPPVCDVRTGTAQEFLGVLPFVMGFHNFARQDDSALGALALLGVERGKPFDPNRLDASGWARVREGFEEARRLIAQKADNLGPKINGWSYSPLNAGNFGTDYLTRAACAWKYIYVQSPKEVIYPTADVDATGEQLDGSKSAYEVAFDAGGEPPARYFWSITLYDKETGFLVENDLERYSIGDRTAGLGRNAEGGLTIIVSSVPPMGDAAANWLPAPAKSFFLTMRIYGPEPSAVDGSWKPPVIRKVKT